MAHQLKPNWQQIINESHIYEFEKWLNKVTLTDAQRLRLAWAVKDYDRTNKKSLFSKND